MSDDTVESVLKHRDIKPLTCDITKDIYMRVAGWMRERITPFRYDLGTWKHLLIWHVVLNRTVRMQSDLKAVFCDIMKNYVQLTLQFRSCGKNILKSRWK